MLNKHEDNGWAQSYNSGMQRSVELEQHQILANRLNSLEKEVKVLSENVAALVERFERPNVKVPTNTKKTPTLRSKI